MVRRKSFINRQKQSLIAVAIVVVGLLAFLTIETMTDKGAQGDFIEGIHYTVLDQPRRIRGDKIEVMEFFSYGCIHCYRFDDDLQQWAEARNTQVRLVRTPLIGSDLWRLYGEHFYTLQNLNAPQSLHQATFRALHDLGRNLNSPQALADFVQTNSEFDQDNYLLQRGSPAVARQVGLSDRLARTAKITSVPQLVIQGRYKISTTQNVGPQRMLEVADYLIEQLSAESTSEPEGQLRPDKS